MSTVPSRGDDPPIPPAPPAGGKTETTCESCGMPLETGRYCGYCTDEHGELQSFDERFARMVDWQARRNPGTARTDLERQTLDYMATMPAWRDHPRVAQRS
jgi:hypothetical protein